MAYKTWDFYTTRLCEHKVVVNRAAFLVKQADNRLLERNILFEHNNLLEHSSLLGHNNLFEYNNLLEHTGPSEHKIAY